jgi:hypothetical protein
MSACLPNPLSILHHRCTPHGITRGCILAPSKQCALSPRILACAPGLPNKTLPRICINTSSTVMALWLAGRINPSRSDDLGTCRFCSFGHLLDPPLDGLSGGHWMVCQVILIARLLPTPALIFSAPGATPSLLPPKSLLLPAIFPGCTPSISACRSLGFEGPAPGIPADAQTCCQLDIIAATARFLRGVFPTPSPLTPPRPLLLLRPPHLQRVMIKVTTTFSTPLCSAFV